MTIFIRKYLLNAYTALPLLFCLLFTTWSSYASPLTGRANSGFSGEDMFRGLFFLEGQYAKAIPELQSLRMSYSQQLVKPAHQAVLNQMRTEMIQAIKAQQPHYFDQFRAALESGNFVKVQAALNEGKTLATKTVERLYNLDSHQLEQLQNQASKLAQTGKLTKETLDQMAKSMNRNQYATRQDNGTCVVIYVYNICTLIALCLVAVVLPTSEEMVQNNSSLLSDQLVASICRLAGHHS
ncbi:hypothetical protein [Spirosoma sp. KNUC1025]|uniref:hypothetical protein n=1 Tax=Spirosoma sp. KNUC1025 TaxID=2894082 RepID=UPI003870A644|nr:hypothetical protein LN737_02690 [Spirosoma sp. KNUC1025]